MVDGGGDGLKQARKEGQIGLRGAKGTIPPLFASGEI